MALLITGALCCNPFNVSEHKNIRNNLRNLLSWMTEKCHQLNSDCKVCDRSHKKISKLRYDASNKERYDSDSDETESFDKITGMRSLNESLKSM
jgi:hypothetical protein